MLRDGGWKGIFSPPLASKFPPPANQAALAGLATFSQQMLEQLAQLIAEESQFAEMGPALEVLYALWQRDDIGGMQNAVVLEITLSAALDRTLWLCESSGVADESSFTPICIAGRPCATSCAISTAAAFYRAFRSALPRAA